MWKNNQYHSLLVEVKMSHLFCRKILWYHQNLKYIIPSGPVTPTQVLTTYKTVKTYKRCSIGSNNLRLECQCKCSLVGHCLYKLWLAVRYMYAIKWKKLGAFWKLFAIYWRRNKRIQSSVWSFLKLAKTGEEQLLLCTKS